MFALFAFDITMPLHLHRISVPCAIVNSDTDECLQVVPEMIRRAEGLDSLGPTWEITFREIGTNERYHGYFCRGMGWGLAAARRPDTLPGALAAMRRRIAEHAVSVAA